MIQRLPCRAVWFTWTKLETDIQVSSDKRCILLPPPIKVFSKTSGFWVSFRQPEQIWQHSFSDHRWFQIHIRFVLLIHATWTGKKQKRIVSLNMWDSESVNIVMLIGFDHEGKIYEAWSLEHTGTGSVDEHHCPVLYILFALMGTNSHNYVIIYWDSVV